MQDNEGYDKNQKKTPERLKWEDEQKKLPKRNLTEYELTEMSIEWRHEHRPNETARLKKAGTFKEFVAKELTKYYEVMGECKANKGHLHIQQAWMECHEIISPLYLYPEAEEGWEMGVTLKLQDEQNLKDEIAELKEQLKAAQEDSSLSPKDKQERVDYLTTLIQQMETGELEE